jgi:hypothetical protein
VNRSILKLVVSILLFAPFASVVHTAPINSEGTVALKNGRYIVIADRDYEITNATILVTPENIRIFTGDLEVDRAATVVSATPFDGVSMPVAEKVIVYETMSDAE